MALDRTEGTGLAVAIAAHAVLLIVLSLSFNPKPRSFENPPMAVDIIAEKAPVSTAPEPAKEPPAAQRGEEDANDPVPPPPPPPDPVVKPRQSQPTARSTPSARPAATSRVTPPQRQQTRPPPATRQPDTSDRRRPDRPNASSAQSRPNTRQAGDPLADIANSVARSSTPNARGRNPPAQQTAAQVRADIRVSINAEVRAPWNSCRVTGIDVDTLRTTVVFALQRNGALDRIVSVNTTGVNDSNRPQVQRFEECARRAITLAAPFDLPAEHFSYWQNYTLDFEKR